MRKTIAFLFIIACFSSCQKEAFIEEGGDVNSGDVILDVDPTDEEVFDVLDMQEPRPSLDASNQGLYRGVFSTYDSVLHGEILINVGNDGGYSAAIHFVSGLKLAFQTDNRSYSNLLFSNERGSFKFDVSDLQNPVASNVIIDEKPGYIIAFKETSMRRLSIVLGHFYDNTDLTFKGSWDLVSFGIPEFNFPGAKRIEKTIVSNGVSVFVDSESDQMEAFNGCFGFNVNGAYLAQVSQDIFVVEGKGQTATLNDLRCEWNLSYSLQNNIGQYSNESCEPGNTSGFWSWNDRSGSIYVDAIRFN